MASLESRSFFDDDLLGSTKEMQQPPPQVKLVIELNEGQLCAPLWEIHPQPIGGRSIQQPQIMLRLQRPQSSGELYRHLGRLLKKDKRNGKLDNSGLCDGQ